MHELHNDYTLAGEKIKVTKQMLYKYQLEIIEDNNFSLGKKNLYSRQQKKIQTLLLKHKTLIKFTVKIKNN